MRLQDLMRSRAEAQTRLENQVSLAEKHSSGNMPSYLPGAMAEVQREIADLDQKIRAVQASPNNSIGRMVSPQGMILTDGVPHGERFRPRAFSHEYRADLLTMIQSNGKKVSESLLDHADSVGGYRFGQLVRELERAGRPAPHFNFCLRGNAGHLRETYIRRQTACLVPATPSRCWGDQPEQGL